MSKVYEIPKKMRNYLRRVATEYNKSDLEHIGKVIDGSEFSVKEETDYDNWDGGQYGHDLILLVPDRLMGNIPLDEQRDIQTKLVQDLNKAASSVRGEYVADVHFEYLDEDEHEVDSISHQEQSSKDNERLWQPNSIHIFVSHRDIAKKQVKDLASQLMKHRFSSFVAHDTIEPDEDWQREIEKALQSMDAMLAFITDDFFQSTWTNQEIGYALARGIPIISIMVGKQEPFGFIRNRQAIKGNINHPAANARKVREALRKRLYRSARYREWAIARFISAVSYEVAGEAFEDLKFIRDLTDGEITRLVSAYNTNDQLYDCFKLTQQNYFLNWVNEFGFEKYAMDGSKIGKDNQFVDDDIPF